VDIQLTDRPRDRQRLECWMLTDPQYELDVAFKAKPIYMIGAANRMKVLLPRIKQQLRTRIMKNPIVTLCLMFVLTTQIKAFRTR
jgi:hypothetical protein